MRRPAPNAGAPIPDRSGRVMRWTFRRQDETVVCEIGLSRDHAAYEIRINPPWNPTGVASESFNDAIGAFERYGALERCLIEEGWSLESFESGRTPR